MSSYSFFPRFYTIVFTWFMVICIIYMYIMHQIPYRVKHFVIVLF